MTQSIGGILDASLRQLAAEAFIVRSSDVGVSNDPGTLTERLRQGNGHVSRFLDNQSDAFLAQYKVLAQFRNDPQDRTGTGFSGTLFKNLKTNELTLSFRSTEFIEDAVRDGKSTNELEIKELGWAIGQIAAMEDWYRALRSDPALLKDRQFHVTGYSLGGHLATAFNLLRAQEARDGLEANPILDTVTFNGAGVGGLQDGVSLQGVLDTFNRLRSMPDMRTSDEWTALDEAVRKEFEGKAYARLQAIQDEAQRLAGLQATFAFDLRPAEGAQYSFNYQLAALYATRFAIPVTGLPYTLEGTNLVPIAPVFASDRISTMTEVVGADFSRLGLSFVANSGIHYGTRAEVPIEDQPLLRGAYNLPLRLGSVDTRPDVNDFADTHSLLLIIDSLSLLSAFERLDPAFTLERGEEILAAASSASARTVPLTQGRAEGDTLERTLDALATLLLGPGQAPTLPDYAATLEGNTWHLDAFRVPFHEKLARVNQRIEELGADPTSHFRVQVLSDLSPSLIAELASTASRDGYAYRYALQNLDSFALLGFQFDQHNVNRELELASGAADGMTRAWIDARAEMLGAWIRDNKANGSLAVALGPLFMDVERSVVLGSADAGGATTTFGGALDDSISGNVANDRLFGGTGNDLLSGLRGRDHLEGGAGDDRLEGGPGDDRLVGGSGFDTYVYALGDGRDSIYDADGAGRIRFLGRDLAGGEEVAPGVYEDASGTRYVLLDSGDGMSSLLVNGMLEIEEFESGDLGIVLDPAEPDEVDPPEGGFTYLDTYYPVGSPQGGGDEWFVATAAGGSDGDDAIAWTHGGDVLARGGNDDVRISGVGPVFAIGGSGADVLDASAALPSDPSVLAGGSGDDLVIGSERADTLVGDNWQVSIAGPANSFGARIDGFSYDLGFMARQYGQIDPVEVSMLSQAGAYGPLALRLAETARVFADERTWTRALDVIRHEEWTFPAGFEAAVAYVQGPAPTFDDHIEGNGGGDTIFGGSGSDVIQGGDGGDRIEGDGEGLTLFVSASPEWQERLAPYLGEPGDDILDGGPGDDDVFDLSGGNDYLRGGEGNDRLQSEDGDDEVAFNLLDGGDGDDVLVAGGHPEGFDLLVGGEGNDILEAQRAARLEGGAGDDLYRFADAVVRDTGGVDRIESLGIVPPRHPAADFLQSSLDQVDDYSLRQSIVVQRDGMDLVYQADIEAVDPELGEYGDHYRLVIEDWYAPGDHRIEQVDSWSADDFEHFGGSHFGSLDSIFVEGGDDADTMFGSMQADLLVGGDGADLLAGRLGDDILDGGPGDDQYFFARGHGHDLVFDDDGRDDLRLAPGLTEADVALSYTDDGLRLSIADGSVTLADIGPGADAGDLPIDRILFADGTSLDLATALARVPLPEEPPVAGEGSAPTGAAPAPAGVPTSSVTVAASAGPPALAGIASAANAPGNLADPLPAFVDPPLLPARSRGDGTPDRTEAPVSEDEARNEVFATARVGESFDPVYRDIDARLDVLLQAGRAGFAERYAEAIDEFNRRSPQADPATTPSSSSEDFARWNDAMHAWHAANPAFDVGESGSSDRAWLAGWGSPTGGSASLDELVVAGGAPSLSNPLAARLQGARSAPGLAEGLADLRA